MKRSPSVDHPTAPSCIIEVIAPSAAPRHGEPITIGVPLPKAFTTGAIRVVDSRGIEVPSQSRVLDTWPDGSARWLLIDFQAECTGGTAKYEIAASTGPIDRDLTLAFQKGDRVHVDTGVARVVLSAATFPFESVSVADGSPIDCARTALRVEDQAGTVYSPRIDAVQIEENGPLRACVAMSGTLAGEAFSEPLDFTARLHFFRNLSTVRIATTLRNPAPMGHPNGFWELGSSGSAYLRDVSLVLALSGDGVQFHCSPACDVDLSIARRTVEIYQDSSGGERWQSLNHINRAGIVPTTFRGYRLTIDEKEERGLRATPLVAARWPGHEVSVTMEKFWQNFPMAIEGSDGALIVRMYPRQHADVQELQGGEQKTHRFSIGFGVDSVTARPLDWCRAPSGARLGAEWYSHTRIIPGLVPASRDPNPGYLALVNAALSKHDGFVAKRETIDEYGWRHFGDLYADHEAVPQTSPPLISHYNNQYDAIAGFAVQFMRSGDLRWMRLLKDLAEHVADIDIYHTRGDKSAYNGGLFWHTSHYIDAGKSAHRSYPRDPRVWGGGPSAEHDYSSGLMLAYFMTGESLYREATLQLARWVADMDDGRRTIFRWVTRADTGWATATGGLDYHGPGRGSAYSITTLLNGYRLSGEAAFLMQAEKFIRRCIHPSDDIEARDLLNAERRWSYTVFLQALEPYLQLKEERNQIDAMYWYARRSLLRYAEWMCSKETPYLERSEQLEFPTETWAAQDMRKSEVFRIAAAYSDGASRGRFSERSRFFFHYSTDTLAKMPTHVFTRPLVLMLTNGYLQASLDEAASPSVAGGTAPEDDYGTPTVFVPQKAIARKRVIVAAVAAGLMAILAAIGVALG